ncbi:MAG: RIP metalloprotease RseP [Akkermansiaceae bacterium]|nr:RIP metalloprotease RseP [Akkermansiaceae bacterium]
MAVLHPILTIALLILVVLTIFNIIIFVHELGHFLAAKWRGLQVDRFQIWFGKPIWKKTIGGVQYGLGWIPAGGFVALPQMAPMESIEGSNRENEEKDSKPLPPIKPLDKIIVAFAGPLFSMLLALAAAFVVWGVGKPKDKIPVQTIGFVESGSPADKSGMKPGDKVIEINGKPVDGFTGTLDSIKERIILSSSDEIVFTVIREGEEEPIKLRSKFDIPETQWWERGGLRRVGISYASKPVVHSTLKKSPASKKGLKKGDEILSVDGKHLYSPAQLGQYLQENEWKTVTLKVRSKDGVERELEIKPVRPEEPEGRDPMLGIRWDDTREIDLRIVHPGPLEQVYGSVEMMWVTITSLANPKSEVGFDHLSGPVGIGGLMYDLIQTENGWRRILAFMVLFNVNLAVLNMLPMPVLDGGHITLAILEKICGGPVGTKPLEIIQTICALALLTLMLYVTSKDVADRFDRGGTEVVFPE